MSESKGGYHIPAFQHEIKKRKKKSLLKSMNDQVEIRYFKISYGVGIYDDKITSV